MFSIATQLSAQTPIRKPDLSTKTKIAPAYFGPNAFPVPDMLDGRTSAELKVELYGDCFLGTTASIADDITADIFARLTIPLFTPKVNLTVWMPIFEYFHSSPAINEFRRIQHEGAAEGFDSGDVYVSADVRILSQERHHCDITARVALKTASANNYAEARAYDSPGYFFDISVGRDFLNKDQNNSLRLAASTGFLCWQTDNGRQNDAVMYGLMLAYTHKRFTLDTCFGGYIGWENDGDRPMTLKTNLSYRIGNLQLRLSHQMGFMDWPFHQIRIGASYAFNILERKRK
jgi:hypothetical protein